MQNKNFMLQAINLAKKAKNNTFPNPLVGAVVVKDGKIIGKGYHQKFGTNHAEVNAIKNCTESPENASIYVNLEPCSHYGKTPPCTDIIIKSGIKNVYIGMVDPNPIVSGNGIKKLQENGINVHVGILEEKCKKLNEVFIKLITRKESFLTHKIASTLDGKIAESTGNSKWITSDKSRNFVHKLRSFCNAILVGANTIRKDNPHLNVRKNNKVISEPFKVIITKSLKFDLSLNIFKNIEKVILVTSEKNQKQKMLKNFNTILLPEKNNQLVLSNLNKELYKKGIYHIFAEGGSMLNYALFKYKLVDKLYIFYANKMIIGNGINMFNGNPLYSLNYPLIIDNFQIKKMGNDFYVEGYPKF